LIIDDFNCGIALQTTLRVNHAKRMAGKPATLTAGKLRDGF
jgi:hypothetical protein